MEEPKTQTFPAAKNTFLECERGIVFILMMLTAGYFGAFTYSIRGGVFCNAQTGNFVLLAMALGNGQWFHALYFVIPITAYCVGTMLSEVLPGYVKKSHLIRWDTLLIVIEIFVVIFLGFLPESAPVQITQVLINFICSMQYNTFRQAEGIPMATTFCTNQLRQVGVGFAKMLRKGDRDGLHRALFFLGMLGCFFAGGVLSTGASHLLFAKAIWLNLLPLGIVLVRLVHADLTEEKGLLSQKPAGH